METPFALIVENDRISAATFLHALRLAGFETETVSHSQILLERLANCQPWLLILDLDMPGISGNQVLEGIRSDVKLRHIKVIAVTSSSQVAERLSVEPDLLLFKPVSTEQVADFIARLQLKLKYQTTIPMLGEPWDRVTGLYNQSFFAERLENALAEARETGNPGFAVLTISIDEDNCVKDQMDIRTWIAILREAAETLKFAARPTDTVARFDQDNFYVLIENVPDQNMPRMIAFRIYRGLQGRLSARGHRLQFPIRIGIALGNLRYENSSEILRDAEAARELQDPQSSAFSNALSKTA